MRPEAIARRQHGLITSEQARAAGLTPGEVRHRLASGVWETRRRGVYAVAGMPPTSDECFIHCAKALRRSRLWEPSTWSPTAAPTAAEVIVDQHQLTVDPAEIEAELEEGYVETLWLEGGR